MIRLGECLRTESKKTIKTDSAFRRSLNFRPSSFVFETSISLEYANHRLCDTQKYRRNKWSQKKRASSGRYLEQRENLHNNDLRTEIRNIWPTFYLTESIVAVMKSHDFYIIALELFVKLYYVFFFIFHLENERWTNNNTNFAKADTIKMMKPLNVICETTAFQTWYSSIYRRKWSSLPPSRPLGCLSPSARMIDRRGCYRHAYVALSSKIERVNGAKAFQRS